MRTRLIAVGALAVVIALAGAAWAYLPEGQGLMANVARMTVIGAIVPVAFSLGVVALRGRQD